MKIETWGEDSVIATNKLEKKWKRIESRKERIRLKRKNTREKRRYKPSFKIRISPFIPSGFLVVILFFIIVTGFVFVKIAIFDNSIIVDEMTRLFGTNNSIIDFMLFFIIMSVPLYMLSKLFFRGSHGHI